MYKQYIWLQIDEQVFIGFWFAKTKSIDFNTLQIQSPQNRKLEENASPFIKSRKEVRQVYKMLISWQISIGAQSKYNNENTSDYLFSDSQKHHRS